MQSLRPAIVVFSYLSIKQACLKNNMLSRLDKLQLPNILMRHAAAARPGLYALKTVLGGRPKKAASPFLSAGRRRGGVDK